MSPRRQRLEARREQLLRRSADLRMGIAAHAQVFQAPLNVADRALAAGNWLVRNPGWPLGVLALGLVLRPRALLRWTGRAVWAWQLWRQARPIVARVSQVLER